MTNYSLITIATIDYVPQALVALRSARTYSQFVSTSIFVSDAPATVMNDIRQTLGSDASWVTLIGPEDLGEEKATYLETFNYYNKVEVANFSKYVALSHLMKQSYSGDVCVFVDSDMLFTGDVLPELQKLDNKAVFLTPHLLKPFSDDLDHEIMIHGWVNAGFMAFNKNHEGSRLIIEWLISRISKRGYFSPTLGLSCDQTWVSGIPQLFRNWVHLSNHAGINVAYWNIKERPLTKKGELYFAGNDPLVLFHFSGFPLNDSGHLSKHAPSVVEKKSPLDELCQLYRKLLLSTLDQKNDLLKLTAIPCEQGSLKHRIDVGSSMKNVTLYKTMPRPGFFTLLGTKLDAVLRRLSRLYGEKA